MLAQEDSFGDYEDASFLAQVGEEDKSISAQIFKYWNIAMDSVYGIGCRFT